MSSILILQLYELHALGQKWLNNLVVKSVAFLLLSSLTDRLIRAEKPCRRQKR
jgi:hypothetical protein